MLFNNFTAAEYAKENKVSVSTARVRLQRLEWSGEVDSHITYEDNPKAHSRINYGTMPPVRVRYYFFKENKK
jgi:response regulator of citrate/malate metabolism